MPVTAQLDATQPTVRPRRPTCSVTHRPARSVMARRGAAMVVAGPRPGRTLRRRAPPPVLAPHQQRRSSEARQVREPTIEAPRSMPVSRTPGTLATRAAHVDAHRLAGWSSTAKAVTSGSPTRRSHMRSVGLHRTPERCWRCPHSSGPCDQPRGSPLSGYTPLVPGRAGKPCKPVSRMHKPSEYNLSIMSTAQPTVKHNIITLSSPQSESRPSYE